MDDRQGRLVSRETVQDGTCSIRGVVIHDQKIPLGNGRTHTRHPGGCIPCLVVRRREDEDSSHRGTVTKVGLFPACTVASMAAVTHASSVSKRRWRPGTARFDLSVTAIATFAFSLVALAPVLDRLKVAWGPGDLLSHYVNVDLWAGFGYRTSTHYGFPGGMNPNLFPGVDITQNSLASALSQLFKDPFIGLNLVAIASFPITAVLAVLAFRLVGLTGWWAIALSLCYTFLPYHWGRLLGHTYLGTMYAAVTGVILALLIGQGRLSRHAPTRVWTFVGILVLITAWSNVYYAAFGLLVMITALFYRFLQRDRLITIVRTSIPIIATFALVVIGFVPSIVARLSEPGVAQLGARFSYESVTLAGSLSMLLLPAPVSQLPYMGYYNEAVRGLVEDAPPVESVSETNFGTWVLLAAMVFLISWWVQRKRRGLASPKDLQLLTLMVVVTLAFFIPWGLNSLIAEYLSAQIRAWNRLVPTLALLILLSAAVALGRSRWNARSWRYGIPMLVLGVVLVEQVIPYRAVYSTTVARYAQDTRWAQDYAVIVNAAIPQRCGIAQFPSMIYPENGPVPPGLNDYEHFWQPLTNPNKDFSFGAVRFSEAAGLTGDIDLPLSPTEVTRLKGLGFCAIHIDLRGYEPEERARVLLTAAQTLGPNVATGREGDWVLYRLP